MRWRELLLMLRTLSHCHISEQPDEDLETVTTHRAHPPLLHCCHCSGHSLMLAFNPGHQMSAGRADTTPPHTPPATIVIRLEYNNWVWRSVNTTTTELYWHSSCNVISVILSWKHHLYLHLQNPYEWARKSKVCIHVWRKNIFTYFPSG